MTDPLRIYIGCSPAEWLPAKVLEHSIRRHTQRPVEITRLCDVPIEIPVPRDPKNRAVTLFSFQRFIVPEAAGFQGMALYLDSDMLVFSDIGELFDIGAEYRVCKWSVPICKPPGWQSAVMLFTQCEHEPSIRQLVEKMDAGKLNYSQLMNLKSISSRVADAFLPQWNHTDKRDTSTKLLHFTATSTQPWVYPKHPLGGTWLYELKMMLDANVISEQDVRAEIMRGHVRPSLLYGPEADKQFTPPFDLHQKVRKQERKREEN